MTSSSVKCCLGTVGCVSQHRVHGACFDSVFSGKVDDALAGGGPMPVLAGQVPAPAPNDSAECIRDLRGECAELRARLARVKRLAGALCKAVNDDEAHEIDKATVRALIALRLAISLDGSVDQLAKVFPFDTESGDPDEGT